MALIVEIHDPANIKNRTHHLVFDECTIQEWLMERYPGFVDFETPTICILFEGTRERPLLRGEWNRKIQPDDMIVFQPVLGTGVEIAFVVGLTVAAIAAAFIFAPDMPRPFEAGNRTVHTLEGQLNKIRLGEPIEVPYGRNRMWPSLINRPYTQFSGGSQFLHALYCIGQGEYDIEEIRIGDAEVGSFTDIEVEVVPPGESVTLFADNVIVSSDVNGIDFPNDTGGFRTNMGGGGDRPLNSAPTFGPWQGPFPASPPGTAIRKIEVDVTLPFGLYHITSSGNNRRAFIGFQFQARPIDDAGNPLDDWFDIVAKYDATDSGMTRNDLNNSFSNRWTSRRSFTFQSPELTPARYEVRARRYGRRREQSRSMTVAVWDSMRAFDPVTPDFGDVTVLAMRARATASFNSRNQERLNVIGTRKLRIWENGEWSSPEATRNPVWALVDIFSSKYGAGLEYELIDLEELEDMADDLESKGVFFDFVFDQSINVWEAAKTVAEASRGAVLVQGSKVSMTRDEQKTVPAMMFTPDNVIKGTFKWNLVFPSIADYDGMLVEYEDEETWLQEEMDASLPGDSSINPERRRFDGVKDRTQAFRLGRYWRARHKYEREAVSFSTGKQGLFLDYRDLIHISHDVPRWGASGVIESIEGGLIRLSSPVVFESAGTHQIRITNSKGQHHGPFDVIAGDNDREVQFSDTPPSIDMPSDKSEKLIFVFGLVTQQGEFARVLRVIPTETEEVQVEAVVARPEPYEHETETPDPRVPGQQPEDEEFATIGRVTVTQDPVASNRAVVSWSRITGPVVTGYSYQWSEDEEDWSDPVITNERGASIEVFPGLVYVRVAAITASGQGPFIIGSGTVGLPVAPELYEKFNEETGREYYGLQSDYDDYAQIDIDLGLKYNGQGTSANADEMDLALGWFYHYGDFEIDEELED